MKKVSTILLLLATMTACADRDYDLLTKQVTDYGMSSYEDKEVKCRIYHDAEGNTMSCKWKSKQQTAN